MLLTADTKHFKELNQLIKTSESREITIDNCIGQRYIAAGLSNKDITINGTPGNALGAYLNGCNITVNGNVQDAVGDTMNSGRIIIYGSCGDATGYAMRGGQIYIEGNVGYRAGIHMKAYEDKTPAIVIGGTAGSFLGEYQAGGTILVLNSDNKEIPVGNFCGTGMHGGTIFLRCKSLPPDLPAQVVSHDASPEELETIKPLIRTFCTLYARDYEKMIHSHFFILRPNTNNPYRQLYVHN